MDYWLVYFYLFIIDLFIIDWLMFLFIYLFYLLIYLFIDCLID